MALCVLSLLVGLTSFVLAQTDTSFFIQPPDAGQQLFFNEDQVYTIGSTFDLQWSTTKVTFSIFLWQQSLSVGSALGGSAVYCSSDPGQFSWTVTDQSFDLTQSPVFFFALGGTAADVTGATTSHYFNLTQDANAVPSSSTSAAATSTTATSIVPTPTTSVISSPTITPILASEAPSPSNTASKVGLGVGLGVGIPLLLVVAYLAFLLIRKSRKKENLQHSGTTPPPPFEKPPSNRTELSARYSHMPRYSGTGPGQSQRSGKHLYTMNETGPAELGTGSEASFR